MHVYAPRLHVCVFAHSHVPVRFLWLSVCLKRLMQDARPRLMASMLGLVAWINGIAALTDCLHSWHRSLHRRPRGLAAWMGDLDWRHCDLNSQHPSLNRRPRDLDWRHCNLNSRHCSLDGQNGNAYLIVSTGKEGHSDSFRRFSIGNCELV